MEGCSGSVGASPRQPKSRIIRRVKLLGEVEGDGRLLFASKLSYKCLCVIHGLDFPCHRVHGWELAEQQRKQKRAENLLALE